jgi:hypothetical protein
MNSIDNKGHGGLRISRKLLALCISVAAAGGTAGLVAVGSAGPASASTTLKGTNSQGSCEGQYASQITDNGPAIVSQVRTGQALGQPGRSEFVQADQATELPDGTCPFAVTPKQ